MKLTPLEIEGAWLAESPVWSDERGFFREWFKSEEIMAETGLDFSVAQANISNSARGVVRGIHYSTAPDGQAKWVTCVSGLVRDVIVDIRPTSKTFGKHVVVELAGASEKAVLIGKGLGHGFVSLADASTVSYLLTSKYAPNHEHEINPFDSALEINWGIPVEEIIVSPKDKNAPMLKELLLEGTLPIE